MNSPWRTTRRRVLLLVGVLALLSGGIAVAALPEPHSQRREQAQRRWEQRPFARYQLTVQIEQAGQLCTQQLEADRQSVTLLRDNCIFTWLSMLHVPRLFELGSRLEWLPECFPSLQNCPCRRVFSGSVTYDPQLGYPASIRLRQEIRPNLLRHDYWLSLWQTRSLPSCGPVRREQTITVVQLTPMD